MAWLVDGIIRLVILILLFFVTGISLLKQGGGYATFGLLLIAQFLLAWFYTTAFEALTSTTPGKRLFGLWVVHDNATPITTSGALVRNFLRAVDNLPFVNLCGLITMMLDGQFRRLGDLAAGTLVIYRDKAVAQSEFMHTAGQPPPEWLGRDDRQSIVDFAERCETLSEERQKELALVLEDLVKQHNTENTDAVDTLKSWAHWIIRGQGNAQSTGV